MGRPNASRMLDSDNFRKFLKKKGYNPNKMDPDDEGTESLLEELCDDFLDRDLDF